MIPRLLIPFKGMYPITFPFGPLPTDPAIQTKYREWGLKGHNGIDFGLPEGTKVLTSDKGKVIQAGVNGDFGISVTIQHKWGRSIYGHLNNVSVEIGQSVKKGSLVGISGKTGFAFGPHLHFGIVPNKPDLQKGYLGYIDPSLFLGKRKKKFARRP